MWFVVCVAGGQDPLDRSVDDFGDIIEATDFAERQCNKGYSCFIYQGIHYKDVV